MLKTHATVKIFNPELAGGRRPPRGVDISNEIELEQNQNIRTVKIKLQEHQAAE